jgi:hypothetical protein
MTDRSLDIHCKGCGAYLYSIFKTSDLAGKSVYCNECQRERDTPMEYFLRTMKRKRG